MLTVPFKSKTTIPVSFTLKMPSKGIQVYSYVSVPGYEVEFAVPKSTVRNTEADNFTSKHLEIESSNLEGGKLSSNYTGEFDWQVYDPDGNVAGSKSNNINTLTGKLESGSMTSTARPCPLKYRPKRPN